MANAAAVNGKMKLLGLSVEIPYSDLSEISVVGTELMLDLRRELELSLLNTEV